MIAGGSITGAFTGPRVVAMRDLQVLLRYGKTGNKNVQTNIAAKRVEKRCCEFYHSRIKPVLQQLGCCRLRKVVVESGEKFYFLQQNLYRLRVLLGKANLFGGK